ncbi:hypothetical protein OZ411_37880 [Bradyrhizobium sp. Arg237L]|uniref:hypothetical protein n=1 Tax=Bradyrhizobium sp. Arg237L TaxID=3003352 RepID=UPI00249E05FB|nr:hypothetical protein [Bradyrhizobium sp. Arg237L]MDI4238573.1 hypothetical protein [Bradyrhizobium sp. Arg237L]
MKPTTATALPGEKPTLLSGALVVSADVRQFDRPTRVNATLPSGVNVVVLLSGRLRITVGDRERARDP